MGLAFLCLSVYSGMHNTPYRIATLAPGTFDLTTISGVRDFVRTRIKDEKQRLIANVAILLGQTSAEQIAKLNGRDAVRRLKAVYGERVAELVETSLVKRNKTIDAPVAANSTGGASSRTTLWRALRHLGHVTMRYLAQTVVTKMIKADPATRKPSPQAKCFTPQVALVALVALVAPQVVLATTPAPHKAPQAPHKAPVLAPVLTPVLTPAVVQSAPTKPKKNWRDHYAKHDNYLAAYLARSATKPTQEKYNRYGELESGCPEGDEDAQEAHEEALRKKEEDAYDEALRLSGKDGYEEPDYDHNGRPIPSR